MNLGFAIRGGVVLQGMNYSYDLHNDFDLQRVVFDVNLESTLALYFTPYHGATSRLSLPRSVVVVFRRVQFIQFDHPFFIHPHGTVRSIGFKGPTDFDPNWESDFDQRSPDMHMVISFFDGGAIRTFADAVDVFAT